MIAAILPTFVLTAIAASLYLLPLLVGWCRHVPDIGSLAVINILLGWTLVGWVVALALALRSVNPASPAVQDPPRTPPWPVLPPGRLPPARSPRWPDAPARRQGAPPLLFPPRPAGPAQSRGSRDRAGQE
jgi:hypothetical protein